MEIQTTNLGRGRGGYNNVPQEDTLLSNGELSDKGDITPV
jgi:hypothetical protein